MKLCYLYDEGYIPLKDYFLSNLKDEFELIEKQIPTPKFGDDFHMHRKFAGGIEVWKEKIKYYLEVIELCEPNECFIYSDVDVIFFKPILNIIEKISIDKDLLMLREIPYGELPQQGGDVGGYGNNGLCLIRSNDRSRKFFREVLHMIENTKNFIDSHNKALWPDGLMDQICINRILFTNKNYDLKWGTFPLTFATTAYKDYDMINKQTVAYHATCVIKMEEKIKLMEQFKQKVS